MERVPHNAPNLRSLFPASYAALQAEALSGAELRLEREAGVGRRLRGVRARRRRGEPTATTGEHFDFDDELRIGGHRKVDVSGPSKEELIYDAEGARWRSSVRFGGEPPLETFDRVGAATAGRGRRAVTHNRMR